MHQLHAVTTEQGADGGVLVEVVVLGDQVGGLPEESQHCALLAANTLRAAIEDYLATKNAPWKRLFRRT